MNPVFAFTIVMLIWAISEFVAKKSKSLISSLLVASVIFLIGFKTNIFPSDLLSSSALLPLGTTVVGLVIVHIGTMISIQDFKRQWRTFVVGFASVLGIVGSLLAFSFVFPNINYALAAIGAVSGGTISVVLVQESALAAGLLSVAVLPVLIAAFQGIIGFPITSLLLRKEARRLQKDYRAGTLEVPAGAHHDEEKPRRLRLPSFFNSTSGTLFAVGVVAVASVLLSNLTGGHINTFIIALVLGVLLRTLGVFKPNVLSGIDAFGLMMLAIMVIIFGPLASVSIHDLIDLIVPFLLSFVFGLLGSMTLALITGKLLGFSLPMAGAIGLTALYGFPGTMILSQETAKSIGETEDEVKAIEGAILPRMIIAGFSTVTITSVFITGIIAGFIG